MACKAEDIHHLNQTKEYTLTATSILENVLTNPNLNAHSNRLWQILFNMAKFDPELSVSTSVNHLAKILNKSARTIHRYISILKKNGYLTVANNFNHANGQEINTYFVRIPKQVNDVVIHIKDRKNLSESAKIVANPVEPSHKQKDADIFDTRGDDKNVVQINNNINNIIKNNNNVVVVNDYSKQEESKLLLTAQLDEKQNTLEQLILAAKKTEAEWLNCNDQNLMFDKHKQFSESYAAVEQCKIEISVLQKRLEKLTINNQFQTEIQQNKELFLSKSGPRVLSEFDTQRLVSGLEKLVDKSRLSAVVNELVHAIRFGNLTKCRNHQKDLSIKHAINIGLKLVREGRWETPAELQN
jgi:hypothetical protein